MTKKRYLSRTIISQFVSIVCFWLVLTWVVNIDEATQTELVDTIVSIAAIISQLLAIYYRIIAKDELI
jgi:hypothetical protein